MKNFIRAALIAITLLSPTILYAEATPNAEKPLLIIRFNQPKVQYKQPLAQVAERAQEAKKDVRFELVSLVPVFEGRDKNTESRQIAEHNAKKVAGALESSNVPADHITIRYQESDNVPMNEVHVVAY